MIERDKTNESYPDSKLEIPVSERKPKNSGKVLDCGPEVGHDALKGKRVRWMKNTSLIEVDPEDRDDRDIVFVKENALIYELDEA